MALRKGGRVSDIMDRKVVAISPTTTVGSAIRLMKSSSEGMLPVIASGKLVGLVDEALLLEYTEFKRDLKEAVETIMRFPVFVEADSAQSDAIRKSLESQLTKVPVVDSQRGMKCVGVVSATELLAVAKKGKKM